MRQPTMQITDVHYRGAFIKEILAVLAVVSVLYSADRDSAVPAANKKTIRQGTFVH